MTTNFTDASEGLRTFITGHYLTGLLKQRLFEQHLGFSLAQCAWNVDLSVPSIILGPDDATFTGQVLGTFLPPKNEWLWAWANLESNLPPVSLRAAETLRSIGSDNDIPELSTATLVLSPELLTMIGASVTSVLGSTANAFFGGNTGQIIVGMLVCEAGVTDPRAATALDIMAVLTGSQQLPVNAQLEAVPRFLEDCGLQVRQTEDGIAAESSDGRSVEVKLERGADGSVRLSYGALLSAQS